MKLNIRRKWKKQGAETDILQREMSCCPDGFQFRIPESHLPSDTVWRREEKNTACTNQSPKTKHKYPHPNWEHEALLTSRHTPRESAADSHSRPPHPRHSCAGRPR